MPAWHAVLPSSRFKYRVSFPPAVELIFGKTPEVRMLTWSLPRHANDIFWYFHVHVYCVYDYKYSFRLSPSLMFAAKNEQLSQNDQAHDKLLVKLSFTATLLADHVTNLLHAIYIACSANEQLTSTCWYGVTNRSITNEVAAV